MTAEATSDRIVIRRAGSQPGLARGLADVLVDCVEAGASVGFMLPLEVERAESYWTDTIDSSMRGERILLVAEDESTGEIVGTVQVILSAPENQPHRGEIAKMLVHRRARRRGVAEALMRAAEAAAWMPARHCSSSTPPAPTPSVSTTGSAGSVSESSPAMRCGLTGGLVDTTVFYKLLAG